MPPMLLWTRDVEQRLFGEMARELALSASERTPLHLLTRLLLRRLVRRLDAAVLAVAISGDARVRQLRRAAWKRLRRVRARTALRGLCVCGWSGSAFLFVTDFVARLTIKIVQ